MTGRTAEELNAYTAGFARGTGAFDESTPSKAAEVQAKVEYGLGGDAEAQKAFNQGTLDAALHKADHPKSGSA